MDRVIFHCDCNSFFASVEELLRPELKTVPMAVAGDPESRHGIILAKNELAKRFNVQTAETIWSQAKMPRAGLRSGPSSQISGNLQTGQSDLSAIHRSGRSFRHR